MKAFLKSLVAPVIVGLLAVTAANGAMYQWSKTAGTNANVDASINWAEGQSPSSINDSARAMMARLAEYRDDISGSLTTGGTSTAYTVTTNQGLPATPTDGQLLAITVHTTNGTAPTLSADSGTAFPIQSAAGTAVGSGVLVTGTPYTLKFSNSASAWVLRNFYGSPFTVPVGGLIPYAGTTSPNTNFALAYGQCISRTTYATLFALVSTTFGSCDGSTTFGLPDLRGRAVFGIDNMGGSAANRITAAGTNYDGTVLGGTGGAQSSTLITANLPPYTPAGTLTAPTGSVNIATAGQATSGSSGQTVQASPTSLSFSNPGTFTGTAQGGTSTAFSNLPPAISLGYIIRIQ